ncbi:TetR/AcrR family transcriptional regulator [Enterovibrio calviensis]|uniref:TetR/AcrR family transcriptional regulator n=1 Tax=Enterovibrio calviensis TaxID=91359 RepID=UPI0037368961
MKSAVKLFAQKGFSCVSLGDVMKDAKLTHGAFYAHFDSKQTLYKEAVSAATEHSPLATILRKSEGAFSVDKLVSNYLCHDHVDQKFSPCPLAAFATDTSNQNGETKEAYTKVFTGLIDILESKTDGHINDRESALSLAALLIGGVVVSRALNDKETIDELLAACISKASKLVE